MTPQTITIIDRFSDLVQCSKCKSYILKKQWKDHKKEHKYDEDGRYA